MSNTLHLPALITTESAECQRCLSPIQQGDIIITTRGRGLGGRNRQHVEAHCRICKCVHLFDREFNGVCWQRINTIEIVEAADASAAMQRRRVDQEHAIRLEQDESEPGRDYME